MTTSEEAPTAQPDEFADYEGEALHLGWEISWESIVNPATLRALATLAAGLFLLFSSGTPRVVAIAIAIALLVWGATQTLTALRSGERGQLAQSAALIGLGLALIVWPGVTSGVIARLLAVVFLLGAARDLVRVTFGGAELKRWPIVRAVFLAVVGAGLLTIPNLMLELVVGLFGVFWIVTGFVTVIANLRSHEVVQIADAWPLFFEWLEQRPHTVDDRHQLYAKLFYEGSMAVRRLSRFFILMGFATAIAASGVIADSTAVVIGAMLIAPLMIPLMGTSLSLVMGWPRRATMSLLVAAGGVGLAIGLSILIGAFFPSGIDPVTNSQVASRVAPTLLDLMIALAAGGAGAFALSRPDVSDSLPGVAVAIALVPPLAVAGLMLESGNIDDALGALLLFATNLVAILGVGALVFVLTGVVPVRRILQTRQRVLYSGALVGTLFMILVVVLGISSERIRSNAFDVDDARRAAQEWVGDDALTVFSVDVSGNDVEVVVVGPDTPSDVEALAAELESDLGRDLDITVRWLPEEQYVIVTSTD